MRSSSRRGGAALGLAAHPALHSLWWMRAGRRPWVAGDQGKILFFPLPAEEARERGLISKGLWALDFKSGEGNERPLLPPGSPWVKVCDVHLNGQYKPLCLRMQTSTHCRLDGDSYLNVCLG